MEDVLTQMGLTSAYVIPDLSKVKIKSFVLMEDKDCVLLTDRLKDTVEIAYL